MDIETWEEVAKEAKEFIGKLVNPALEETGQILGDNIKYWRFRNEVNILIKAKKYLDDKGIEPRNISLKTLVPLLEYSSLEEDENLRNKWAALLAKAAEPGNQLDIEAAFIDILRQLSPLEASILDTLYNQYLSSESKIRSEHVFIKEKICENFGLIEQQYQIIIDNLFRLNVLQPYASTEEASIEIDGLNSDFPIALQTANVFQFTVLGLALMDHCQFN